MIAIAMPCREKGTRAEARNKEIERCLKMNPTHILMIDDDQTIPNAGWTKLLGACTDIAVIDTPPKETDQQNVHYNPDGTIAYCTISCSMIKREVFEKLPRPWFDSKYDFQPSGTKNGKIIFHKLDKSTDNNVGEDIYFVRNAIEAGFDTNVVPDIKCKHFDL